MHWLPYDDASRQRLVNASILMPDKTIIKGLAEEGVSALNIGDIIQFERFGFCRLDEIKENKDSKKKDRENNDKNEDSENNKEFVFWFTHK